MVVRARRKKFRKLLFFFFTAPKSVTWRVSRFRPPTINRLSSMRNGEKSLLRARSSQEKEIFWNRLPKRKNFGKMWKCTVPSFQEEILTDALPSERRWMWLHDAHENTIVQNIFRKERVQSSSEKHAFCSRSKNPSRAHFSHFFSKGWRKQENPSWICN